MKLTILMRTIVCAIIVAASAMLPSCEGRAKIAFDNNGHFDDDDDDSSVDIELSASVSSTSPYSIIVYLNIDNYYDDQLYKKMSLKKCGIFYRSTTQSESGQKTANANLNSYFAYITLSNLSSNTSYYITPFVIDNNRPNHTYQGETTVVSTKKNN